MTFVKQRTDRIGQLNDLIDVFREIQQKDAYGTPTKAIEVIQNGLFADCKIQSADEREEMNTLILYEVLIVKIRYRTDIDNNCSLKWQNVIYDIVGVKEIGRKQFSELRCLKREPYEKEEDSRN